MQGSTPTVYEWAGGQAAFDRLTEVFYRRVRDDEILGPGASPAWTSTTRSTSRPGSRRSSAGRRDTPRSTAATRTCCTSTSASPSPRPSGGRWVTLIMDAADEAELPADPEFRSAFVAYVEWGTRLALGNSQPGAAPPPEAPVPRWGWGEAPPYPAENVQLHIPGTARAPSPGCVRSLRGRRAVRDGERLVEDRDALARLLGRDHQRRHDHHLVPVREQVRGPCRGRTSRTPSSARPRRRPR